MSLPNDVQDFSRGHYHAQQYVVKYCELSQSAIFYVVPIHHFSSCQYDEASYSVCPMLCTSLNSGDAHEVYTNHSSIPTDDHHIFPYRSHLDYIPVDSFKPDLRRGRSLGLVSYLLLPVLRIALRLTQKLSS